MSEPLRWIATDSWHVIICGDNTACDQPVLADTSRCSEDEMRADAATHNTSICAECQSKHRFAALEGLSKMQRADYVVLLPRQQRVYWELPTDKRAIYAKRHASRQRVAALAEAEEAARSILHRDQSVRGISGGLPGHGRRR